MLQRHRDVVTAIHAGVVVLETASWKRAAANAVCRHVSNLPYCGPLPRAVIGHHSQTPTKKHGMLPLFSQIFCNRSRAEGDKPAASEQGGHQDCRSDGMNSCAPFYPFGRQRCGEEDNERTEDG